MEQFSLEKYLENPQRKVVTRDERPVRIICTNRKSKSGNIVGLVGEDESLIYVWNNDGKHIVSEIIDNDLFFADEEEKLTEFEKALDIFAYNSKLEASNPNYYDWLLKSTALNLLDLARKEILKDLPKLKKATEHKDLEKHIAILEDGKVLLSNYLEEGDYYIELDNLKTLPKEE